MEYAKSSIAVTSDLGRVTTPSIVPFYGRFIAVTSDLGRVTTAIPYLDKYLPIIAVTSDLGRVTTIWVHTQ